MELPEELRFENLSTPHSAQLFTQKTQPVSFSQSQVRFEIPRRGILNSTAILEWSFSPSGTTGVNGTTFPLNVGCMANIERAVLSTQSGRIIMDNRNFTQKQVCEETFRDGDYSHFLARYLNLSNHSYTYQHPNEPTSAEAVDGRPHTKLRLSGEPIDTEGDASLDGTEFNVPPILSMGGTSAPAVPQSVRVSLQQLFPFLYGVQLPVNIMEQLYLDVYWRQDVSEGDVIVGRGTIGGENGNSYVAGGVVNQDDCFLISDHLVYDDPAVMDKITAHQEANGGLSFPFKDYVVQVVASTAPTDPTIQEYERELGCSNYKLTDMRNLELIGIGGNTNAFFGKYYSNGINNRDIQLVLNDANLFPDNDKTQAENYTELTKLYPNVLPYIPRPIYATSVQQGNAPLPSGALQTFSGRDTQLISGQSNIIAYQLKDIEGNAFQNGNTPIRMFYKKTKGGNAVAPQADITSSSLQYFFVGYMRSFAVAPSGRVIVSEFI